MQAGTDGRVWALIRRRVTHVQPDYVGGVDCIVREVAWPALAHIAVVRIPTVTVDAAGQTRRRFLKGLARCQHGPVVVELVVDIELVILHESTRLPARPNGVRARHSVGEGSMSRSSICRRKERLKSLRTSVE